MLDLISAWAGGDPGLPPPIDEGCPCPPSLSAGATVEGPVHPLSGWLAAKAAIFYIPYNLYATHPPGATRPRRLRGEISERGEKAEMAARRRSSFCWPAE